jgi:two-component SAPR family response regulator
MLRGDVNGIALAQEIRRLYPDMPIVLTSGYAKAIDTRHGLPILRKPYQLSSLAQAIRESLDTQWHAKQAAVTE